MNFSLSKMKRLLKKGIKKIGERKKRVNSLELLNYNINIIISILIKN